MSMKKTENMKILVVDTAEQSCSIALVNKGITLGEAFSSCKTNHSKSLMNMIHDLMGNMTGITIDDVDGFAASCGPGSFTGLRIGISVVKGLAFATSKPVAAISSLDGIAWQLAFSGIPVCAMMDAKRGEVYCALYNFHNGVLKEKTMEMALSPENALEMAGNNVLFAGSGAVAFHKLIKDTLGDGAFFAPGFQNSIRASALAFALLEKTDPFSMGQDALKPVYLRKSDAEIHFENKINPK